MAPDSTTSTFAAMKLEVGAWRWSGALFYLRAGKRLARKFTEVAVIFKPTPHLCSPTMTATCTTRTC